jgi:hypothetical protein
LILSPVQCVLLVTPVLSFFTLNAIIVLFLVSYSRLWWKSRYKSVVMLSITCHYWLLHVYEVYRFFLSLRFKKREYFRCVPTMWYSLFSIGLLFFLIVDIFMLWKITNEHIFYKFNVNIRFQETCDNDNITTLKSNLGCKWKSFWTILSGMIPHHGNKSSNNITSCV